MDIMKKIEELTRRYAEECTELSAAITELETKKRELDKKHLPGIKALARTAKAAKQNLADAIAANPQAFTEPRTVVFHGVRVGLQKAKGKIQVDDVAAFVKLVKRHFKEKFDVLVKTTYKPVKKAVGNLSVEDLKKLGIEVSETGDLVFIKDTASEIDKLVEALLADEPVEVEA